MGYYTDFEIEVIPDEGVEVDFDYLHFKLNKISEYVFSVSGNNGLRLGDSKWYNSKSDMSRLSEQFKNVLFIVNGEGEENGDIWKYYFKNGMFQDANVRVTYTHDEFDSSKLKYIK